MNTSAPRQRHTRPTCRLYTHAWTGAAAVVAAAFTVIETAAGYHP